MALKRKEIFVIVLDYILRLFIEIWFFTDLIKLPFKYYR